MKNTNIRNLSVLVASSLLIAACNPLNKMAKNAPTVQYSVEPNPLEMHAGKVAIKVTGTYPPKYFNKNATAVITPVLKNVESGEIVKEFKAVNVIGEAAEGEGTKITFETGGSFSYVDTVDYSDNMEYTTVGVKAVASFKGKSQELGEEVVLGDGTIITPLLVQNDDKPIIAKDKFTKTVPLTANAEINYLINASNVRPSELKDSDMQALEDFFANAKEDVRVKLMGVTVEAYASPDGEMTKNENLANDRAESASKAVAKQINKLKFEESKAEGFYKEVGKGEDWNGFKTLMNKSNINDKDLIIKILEMYSDLEKREQEIKNMAATYTEVAEKILPQLRRSQIVISAEQQSKTDAEILELLESNPDTLNIEEMLYGATLVDDINKKATIYSTAARVHANEWRAHNNLGYVYMVQNKLADAEKAFQAAYKLDASNPIVNNNLGVVSRLNGNIEKAKEYYNSASGAGSEVAYNQGIIDIIEGNYGDAVTKMGTYNTLNTGLAQILNGNYSKAISSVDGSDDKNSAMGYYLKAIAGARQDNKNLVINNLATALKKDASLKNKAKMDAEFVKYRESSEFTSLLQ